MKKIHVYVLIGVLVAASGFMAVAGLTAAQDDVVPFVVRTANGPGKLDPLDAYDSESIETIMQVVEGLYIYNYSSPEMESIPNLAASMGTWSVDGSGNLTILTIPLLTGVTFHDGSKFNASAVKWNFDRLQYWTYGFDVDNDGELETHPLGTASKTLFAQTGTPILNHTEIVDEYTVAFHLNLESVIWEKLLAFVACSIVLPDADYALGNTFYNRIDINDELIGTGPFMLTDYIFDNEVVFDYFPDYHMTWGADHIEQMIYLIVPDDVTASLAVLNHEIHWGAVDPDYDDQFEADPDLIEIARKASVVYYMQMNLYNMKDDYRYASSFIWNHTYFLEEVLGGRHFELHVPIPDGMQYHYEGFVGEPEYDYEAAQDIILNSADLDIQNNLTDCGAFLAGLNATATRDEWRAVAESDNPLAVFNYTRYESSLVELCGILLQDYLKDIGIKLVILDAMPWDDWVKDYLENPDGHKRLCYSFGMGT
jgi:peptide/nickel transport system substrate-binding protein